MALGPVLGETLGPALSGLRWRSGQHWEKHWAHRATLSTGRFTGSFTGRHTGYIWEMHSGHLGGTGSRC
jgi:hypothetical protein